MSAKTRGKLLELISDLQARPPALTQQPTITVTANPNRKWIIGAIAGGSLVAVAVAVAGFIVTWPSGSSPSPTVPVPTRNQTVSSGTGGTYLPPITDDGKRYTADVTITAVDGNRMTTRDSIDEEVSAPPSRP